MDEIVYTDTDGMEYCRPCSRWFKDHTAIMQHFLNSGRHDYCTRCDREFVSYIAKNQHTAASSHHNICHLQVCRSGGGNGGDFPTRAALLEHFRDDSDHHYCFDCHEDFSSDEARATHRETDRRHHWCTRCERDFISDAALLQHWQSSAQHFLCRVCKRDFWAEGELVQHQKIHQPRTIQCACPFTFACFSALVIHWEAGNCTTTRAHLNKLVLSFPEHRLFTVAQFMQYLNGNEDRVREGSDWNWSFLLGAWVCPIDGCDSRFHSMAVLDQHLKSPFHDVAAFKCPNSDCDSRFSCLSGLLQHVENSKMCSEGINAGTGCLGRLWLFLLEKFDMLPPEEDLLPRDEDMLPLEEDVLPQEGDEEMTESDDEMILHSIWGMPWFQHALRA